MYIEYQDQVGGSVDSNPTEQNDEEEDEEEGGDFARPSSAIRKERERHDHMQLTMLKKPMFDSFFEHLPFERVLAMSHSSRKSENVADDPTFGYGEIDFEPFADLILSLPVDFDIDLNSLPNFVDLGSGCGRVLFAALFLDVFDRVTGIELLSELHKASISAFRKYQRSDFDPDGAAEICLVHGDATFIDWSGNDLVFSHCSAFDDKMMRRINKTANLMHPGAVIITLTHRLPDESMFQLLGTRRLSADWGLATAFIYRRRQENMEEGMDDPMLHLEVVLNRHIPNCS